jgi:stress-induced morphogen
MPMPAKDIEQAIRAALPDAEVTITDLAGDGDHYSARVESAAFKGKSRVQQHKMVYDALSGRMGGVLHALALQTVVKEPAS